MCYLLSNELYMSCSVFACAMSGSTELRIFTHLDGPCVPEPVPGKTETQSVCHQSINQSINDFTVVGASLPT